MRTTFLIVAAMAATGCASDKWADRIGKPERDRRQQAEDHREFCNQERNSDDYMDCMRRTDNPNDGAGVGVSIPWGKSEGRKFAAS